MNYGQIKALVEFYSHRPDLAEYMDSFFELARERISKDARLIAMEKIVTLEITAPPTVALPADYLEAISVSTPATGGNARLPYYTRKGLDIQQRRSTGAIGYTIEGGLFDAPGASSLIVNYFARPAVLVELDDTNQVLTDWPSLYLQAALLYVSDAVQDTETEMVAQQNYQRELDAANESDLIGRSSGGGLKMVGN